MLEIRNSLPWEKVIMVVNSHWITYVILASWLAWILIISFVLLEFFGIHALNMLALTSIWLIFSVFLYVQWLNYELDTLIITTNRIVWINQISFLDRSISEAYLQQVQEVNTKTKWFFSNIFNYWELAIQTAWSRVGISMIFCPNAMVKARNILNIVETYKQSHKDVNTPQIKPNI
jgi:hypothetical protein